MSDLPSLEAFKSEILNMRRGSRGGHLRPHKLVMLLSVIEMADRGCLNENKIFLQEPLLSIFEAYFNLVRKKDDLCQPGPPFFHLRSAGFWLHKVKPGREQQYASLISVGGGMGIIHENIDYAYLRDDVFDLISNAEIRRHLRLFLTGLLNPEFESHIQETTE